MTHKLKLVIRLMLVLIIFFTFHLDDAQAGNEKSTTIQSINFDLNNDTEAEFSLDLYSSTPDVRYTMLKKITTEYKYMTSTTYKYTQLQKGKKTGYFELTVKSFLDNTSYMCFLNYYSEKKGIQLKYAITAHNENYDTEIITIKDANKKCNVERNKSNDSGSLPNQVTYLESGDRYIKFNKIVTAGNLGSAVYEIEKSPSAGSYIKSNSVLKITYNINSEAKKEIKSNWILSAEPLVDWKNDLAYKTVQNMDYYNDSYFFGDGSYRTNMNNYVPRSDKVQTYFKNPAGIQIRACKWVLGHGNLFSIMGIYLMYAYADSYNESGYIPTQPMSEWLSKDYKIGYNFYDTRFNSDTMESLMRIYADYPDEYVLDRITSYINFYKNYYKKYQYKVGKAKFVPDYMDITGVNKINPTSLNHFMTETYVMLEYSQLTGDKEASVIGREMLNSIKTTCDKWICSNGDLWYKVTPEGKFTGNDYPLVTYNDLVYFSQFLNKIDGKVPPEIDKMLKSKEKWAKQKGYLNQ